MADKNHAQIGAQTQVNFWDIDVSPAAYAPLGKVRSVSGLGTTRAEVESTTLDSTAVERISGLPDGQQVTFTVTAASDNFDKIKDLFDDASETVDLAVIFPVPLAKSVYITIAPLKFEFTNIQPNTLVEITFMGRITGPVTTTDPHA